MEYLCGRGREYVVESNELAARQEERSVGLTIQYTLFRKALSNKSEDRDYNLGSSLQTDTANQPLIISEAQLDSLISRAKTIILGATHRAPLDSIHGAVRVAA